MAFLTSAHKHLELRVDDVVHAETRLGQVARVWSLHHEQDDAGVCSVEIGVKLLLFSLVNGELSERLPETRFVTLKTVLKGNNDTLVEYRTGRILAIRDVPGNVGTAVTPHTADPADWGALCRSFEVDTMLQGDWFEEIRDGRAIITGEWIVANLQQAYQMGRFSQP